MDVSIADEPASWPVTGSRDLFRDDWVMALREDTVERPDHPEDSFPRLVFEHPGAVVVLALDEQERACCIRQFRHPVQRSFVELPAGLCDTGGEDLVATGRRELREEVELEAETWRLLVSIYPSAGISNEEQHLFLARGLRQADRGDFPMLHEEAELEVLWVPVEELIDAVLDGRIRQGPLAAAVLAYDALRHRGRI